MDQVAQVREKTDVVLLLSEYIPLKKAGRNYKALCPFHSEKSPSFVVSSERQIWHCFGCGKGGDCYTFLMEYEKLEFIEALRMLARRAGVTLVESPFSSKTFSQKERLYKINRLALDFYHYLLTKHKVGKNALVYLQEKRGIKLPIIGTFKLGFSPSLGTALVAYLTKKKNCNTEDIVAAGLGFYKNGRLVDFFANRIIFPIFDHRDNIVGFSGRVLNDNIRTSKYINTRETLIYHKGSVLFGLNTAKEHIKKEGRVLVVEGEFDVISLFQEGVNFAVAVKGTALTENHANLLSRFVSKVSLCFDQDKAGEEAAKRSLSFLEDKGLTVTVVQAEGKDPDEAVRKDSVEFKKALKHDDSIYDFFLTKALQSFDAATSEGKKHISDELLPLYAKISNEIVKEHYLKKLVLALDTSYESILRQIEKVAKNGSLPIQVATSKDKKDRREVVEEYFLALLIQSKEIKIYFSKIVNILERIEWKIPAYKKIYESLLQYFEKKDVFDSRDFVSFLPQELHSAFDTCYLLPILSFFDEKHFEEEVIKTARQLRMLALRSEMKKVGEEIKMREKMLIEKNLSLDEDEALDVLRKKLLQLTSVLQK